MEIKDLMRAMLQTHYKTCRADVKDELIGMGFTIIPIPDKFIEDIVKTFFTPYGFQCERTINECLSLTSLEALSMEQDIKKVKNQLKTKFDVTISDIKVTGKLIEFSINF